MNSLLERVKKRYQKEQFHPGCLALFINPFYFARSYLRDAVVFFQPSLTGRILDVGCGSKPYHCYFGKQEYIGLDMDSEVNRHADVADYFYDGSTFPFADATFDSVICNQVLEHVFNPKEFLGEIHRVMKPGGRLLLTVPFVWDEHEQPHDFARYTTFGLKKMCEDQGLRWIEHRKLGGDISILFQLTNAYLFKIFQPFPRWVLLGLSATLMASVNCAGAIIKVFAPRNGDLFLDHAVLAEKL